MACLEIRIFEILIENHKSGNLETIDKSLAAIAITPLASITAITIAILVGVFRKYHGNEISDAGRLLGKAAGEN
ncbi:MAG: hypothetical protein OXC62_04440 [Aestuariivita sp.]|nr:hypothetical protein [Aestuariivita sp.]